MQPHTELVVVSLETSFRHSLDARCRMLGSTLLYRYRDIDYVEGELNSARYSSLSRQIYTFVAGLARLRYWELNTELHIVNKSAGHGEVFRI